MLDCIRVHCSVLTIPALSRAAEEPVEVLLVEPVVALRAWEAAAEITRGVLQEIRQVAQAEMEEAEGTMGEVVIHPAVSHHHPLPRHVTTIILASPLQT